MSQSTEGPILDYASPGEKMPLRLAAQSIITVTHTPDAALVVETLIGKGGAIGAIAFSLTSTCILAFPYLEDLPRYHLNLDALIAATIASIPLFTAILVTLLVIHSTWRRTILGIRAGSLTLSFESPFTTKRYVWPDDRIRRVCVTSSADPQTLNLVHLLQIETWPNPLVLLFKGHAQDELAEIAAMINSKVLKNPAG